MKERRALDRFSLRLPAKIQVVPRDPRTETHAVNLETDNICSGGAYFHTLSPLEVGTRVKIDFTLKFRRQHPPKNRGSLIKVKGSVLRSEPTGMAIGFDRSYKILAQPSNPSNP